MNKIPFSFFDFYSTLSLIKFQEKLHDIIRHITTDTTIPTTSAHNAAHNTNLLSLIFTLLVYTAIVYMVVSVEPIITDAISPILLSTPKLFIISVAIAIEPLPDIGLSIASGSISLGTLKVLNIGFIIFITKSIVPEFLSITIAKNNPTNVGKIFITISIPSFAPFRNKSKVC